MSVIAVQNKIVLLIMKCCGVLDMLLRKMTNLHDVSFSVINNLSTPSSELQINFGVLQIDTENSATGIILFILYFKPVKKSVLCE